MPFISNGTTILDNGAFSVSLGSQILISEQTASSSASIEFTSGIDSTYDIYKFEFINIHPQTDAQHLGLQGSTNGGSSYGIAVTSTLFRSYHFENDSDANVAYRADYDLAQSTGLIPFSDGIATGNDNDQCVSGYIYIYNPSSTTYVKNFISSLNEYHQIDVSVNNFIGGYFNTTSAINAFKFEMSSGNIDDGIIKMYGIKGS
jgi:hypothetical protein